VAHRDKYRKMTDFVICIKNPHLYQKGQKSFYTVGKKYKIVEKSNTAISIIDDVGYMDKFNIFSYYDNYFCSLAYLRKTKLEQINNV